MSYAINFILEKSSQFMEMGVLKNGADMRPEGKRPVKSTDVIQDRD